MYALLNYRVIALRYSFVIKLCVTGGCFLKELFTDKCKCAAHLQRHLLIFLYGADIHCKVDMRYSSITVIARYKLLN